MTRAHLRQCWRNGLVLLALACSLSTPAQEPLRTPDLAPATPPVIRIVGPGDTASDLAMQLRPDGATLEQTLVALWRNNPRAFANGNLNQLLEGATLKVPNAQEILRIPVAQAHALVVEQVEHFQAYARQQARSASAPGSPGSPGPDPAQWARALAEAQSLKQALERQSRDTQERLAQLEKSIQTLQGLQPGLAPAVAEASSAAPARLVPAAQEASDAASETETATPAVSAPAASGPVASASGTGAVNSMPSVPLSVWWAAVALVAVLMWLLTRQRSSAPAPAVARVEIPPQMARISLDLDGPSDSRSDIRSDSQMDSRPDIVTTRQDARL